MMKPCSSIADPLTSKIRDRAAASAEMLAIFGDEALARAALDFEAALAQAQADEGLISAGEADAIAHACADLQLDIAELAEEAAHAGTLAIPLVRHLRARVAARDAGAALKVHLGATSQDVADTALMLQARAGLAAIQRDVGRMSVALEELAEAHAETPMLGRTLLQAALPITFGLKAANWLLGLDAASDRLRREGEAALVLQFGGATGSLAGLGGKAFAISERLAATLGLACPPMPWDARRDAVAGLATALAIVTGAVGKIARDIALMAQGEVAEAFEPRIAGRGGSSAMAHKRNPTGCQVALSASLRAPGLASSILAALPQEHERGLGGWQIEGAVLADLFCLAHGAVQAMAAVVEGLELDTGRMRANLMAADVGCDAGESAALVRRALDHHRKSSPCS
jgi:3-carboxy-cis,cis-muconate cycloisomerase